MMLLRLLWTLIELQWHIIYLVRRRVARVYESFTELLEEEKVPKNDAINAACRDRLRRKEELFAGNGVGLKG